MHGDGLLFWEYGNCIADCMTMSLALKAWLEGDICETYMICY